ncbi:tumor necrosis factor receptor superfamily member 23 isoform X2 [Xyrauchen texanus]|uniref:tumor necrosis factor receptor superfamily member 23 isoform X2 n=1 Tax=Xyrauchen texanus TaxID=154827 RepID=UPI0022419BC5|nr:tumor necrosis factor receptor superfamily member 23 isoform X2 [Xyrauchen texanus]
MFTLLSILLLSSHALSLVQSQNCNEKTEYIENSQCCKKCKQGEMMSMRCKPGLHDTQCEPCHNGYFTDNFNNLYMRCFQCTKCTKEHMKYAKNCTLTHDAECKCDEGYQCRDAKCQMCVKIIQTTTTTTTTATMITRPTPPTDKVWILVSLCFACVCVCTLFICFLLISRHARPYDRIMSTSTCFRSSQKSDSCSSQCTEEEEVPMPVQEVCGKTEKLEEV